MRFALMAGFVMILAPVAAVEAQTSRAPRGFLDVAFVGAQPTGDFGLIVDEGWGVELGGRYELDSTGLLSVRASLGFINYGSEALRFCSGLQLSGRHGSRHSERHLFLRCRPRAG